MAITREQALSADRFHENGCTIVIGPRGGIKVTNVVEWRRNGYTQTWATRPDDFRVPLKYGMYEFSQLVPSNAVHLHVASECRPKIVDNRPLEKQNTCPYCGEYFTHATRENANRSCHEHIAEKHHPW